MFSLCAVMQINAGARLFLVHIKDRNVLGNFV